MNKLINILKEQTKAIPAEKAKALGGAVALAGIFSVGFMMKGHIQPQLRQKPEQRNNEYVKALDSEEIEWLARNIYHEARGESWDGMLAVGVVTLNRVKSPNYPDTIEEVVKEYKQFSWFWDGMSDRVRDPTAWKRAKAAAAEVILNHDLPLAKELEGVTHYHADYISPYWAGAKKEVTTIGRHVFYM